MKYDEVVETIKSYAKQGYTSVTIFKRDLEDYTSTIHKLSIADFTVMFPNPDELEVSWAKPRFRANDALLISMSADFMKLKDSIKYL